MIPPPRLPLIALIALTVLSTSIRASAESSRPNIILFLADDLGASDLGCYGSRFHRSPVLDRLAAEGMRFTDAYSNGPNCAPTRACLQSGLYTPRHGIYTVGSGARGQAKFRKLIPPENVTDLTPSYVTLGEALQGAGYDTAFLGKWHLGQAPEGGPVEQGYGLNVGGNRAGHPKSYFSPYRNPDLPDGPRGEYLTDRLATEALRFLDREREQPFFLHLAFYTVHTPIQGKKEKIVKFEKIPPSGGQGNAAYASMIESLDENIGRILARIDELGLREKTLVLFTSDNGGLGGYEGLGTRNITSNAPFRGGKGMLYEGGIRVPLIARWPGVIAAGSACATPVISLDFYPTLLEVARKPGASSGLDGESFLSLLKAGGPGRLARDALYWHFPGYLQANSKRGTWRTTPGGVIRRGSHKLIEFFEDSRLELYDLAADPGEQNDLREKKPELARELHAALKAWREEVSAPMPRRKKS